MWPQACLGKGTSERVCLDGQLGHLHREMSVGLRACPGICVADASAGRGPQPDRWGGGGAHVCRLDTHACLSIHRVGVASRRQANITVVSLGLDSRQL